MSTLTLLYRNQTGQEKEHTLSQWKESGKYLIGWSLQDEGVRTFRKDRVLQYLDGSDLLLNEPIPEPPAKPGQAPTILFTGFSAVKRDELEALAATSGMKVVKTPTLKLSYLCCGPNAGPTKIEKARQAGAWLMDDIGLRNLILTGELQDKNVII
ncbi:hypothetical protein PWG14_27760 [Chromobacterium amazonense]|uniref:BRCT domain-containing protein n=1 Tax=Chromobacterium amazonense TaxID=1382803 RepID=UPI00237E956B|nr:BRCT domain-containing protein [Chromobacterium amazonense]MDE1716267.1 hypothetical protein [Chromobacterium amazonense]